MNKRITFMLFSHFFLTIQAFAMQEGRKTSKCCDFGNALYTVASKIGRNDYLYLSSNNSA